MEKYLAIKIMNSRCLFVVIFLIAVMNFHCSVENKNTISVNDLSNSTAQLVKINDSLFVRVIPEGSRNDAPIIQSFNKKLEILGEIPCMNPLPILSFSQDSLRLVYYLGKNSLENIKGNFNYYKSKYQKIGKLNLAYETTRSKGNQIISTTNIDSITIDKNKQQINFYLAKKCIDSSMINKLFYSVENKSYHLWNFVDSIEISRVVVPTLNAYPMDIFNRIVKD